MSSKDRSLSLKDKILHLDLIGATILIAAVCCLLLALQWGGITLAWNSSQVIGLFVGFGMLILVFILIQWRLEEKATIPLRFLRQRSIIMGACFSFFINGSNYIVSSFNFGADSTGPIILFRMDTSCLSISRLLKMSRPLSVVFDIFRSLFQRWEQS